MSPDHAVELVRGAIFLSLLIAAPSLGTAILVGVVISLLQAVTQIQEQTLSFAPKMVAMLLILLFTLPWVLSQLHDYSIEIFRNIPEMF